MISREKVWDRKVTYNFASTAFGAGGGRHQSRGTSRCGHSYSFESSETQGKAGCSASLKNKSSIAQCHAVQTTILTEKVEFKVMLPLKTCGQRHSNYRMREGEELLMFKSCLTLNWLLQPELKVHMACLGSTYSHHLP